VKGLKYKIHVGKEVSPRKNWRGLWYISFLILIESFRAFKTPLTMYSLFADLRRTVGKLLSPN